MSVLSSPVTYFQGGGHQRQREAATGMFAEVVPRNVRASRYDVVSSGTSDPQCLHACGWWSFGGLRGLCRGGCAGRKGWTIYGGHSWTFMVANPTICEPCGLRKPKRNISDHVSSGALQPANIVMYKISLYVCIYIYDLYTVYASYTVIIGCAILRERAGRTVWPCMDPSESCPDHASRPPGSMFQP